MNIVTVPIDRLLIYTNRYLHVNAESFGKGHDFDFHSGFNLLSESSYPILFKKVFFNAGKIS